MSNIDEEISAVREEVRFLRDINDIKLLPILYCHYILKFDVEALFSQYTPDGTFQNVGIGTPGFYEGESLRAMIGNGLEEYNPWPFTHNHYIDIIDKSHATGMVHAEFRQGKEAYRVTHIGRYEDEYQKLDGAWKFKSRKLTATIL